MRWEVKGAPRGLGRRVLGRVGLGVMCGLGGLRA